MLQKASFRMHFIGSEKFVRKDMQNI